MSEQKDVALAAREKRARRVQNLKKAIIISLLLAILLPILLCIILFARVGHLEKELEELKAERELQKVEEAAAQVEVALSGQDSDGNQEQEESVKVFSPEEANVLEKTKTTKVYLTFDDGPSGNTNAILDILARYHVQATFFVVGKEGEAYRPLYRRIVEEGHTIGMHSYSHKYNEIYASVDAYAEDLTRLQEYIYETTGTWSRICRFPGGSSNTVSQVDMEELIAYLKEQDIDYFDWNVSSLDATSRKLSVEEIAGNVLSDIEEYSTAVVLMHDADDKTTTVEALPIIIEALQSMENVEILPITDDTVRVQHVIKK